MKEIGQVIPAAITNAHAVQGLSQAILFTSFKVTTAIGTSATLAYSLAASNCPFSTSTPSTWSLSTRVHTTYKLRREGSLKDGGVRVNSPVTLKAGMDERFAFSNMELIS